MSGRNKWTRPIIIAAGVYKISSGSLIKPIAISALFSSPFLPKIIIQLNDLTTELVSSGKIAKASRIAFCLGLCLEMK
ncbi:hypothetical protein D3C85_1487540 [compost metagenome]